MVDIGWKASIGNAFTSLFSLFYLFSALVVISTLLHLTPALWSPSWISMTGGWWDMIVVSFGAAPEPLTSLIEEFTGSKKTRCMSFNEIQAAITAGDTTVSGFYGPGAYLAWLITSWTVAVSSIASSKCASKKDQNRELDLELIPVVMYPIIAGMDVFLRLIRCKIDASMTAAAFVLVTSLSILSPMKRLSIQLEGSELPNIMENPEEILKNTKLWTIRIPRLICHGIVASIVGEAYANSHAIVALWILLFITILYSGVVGRCQLFKGNYYYPFRPWQERVAFFCLVQIIFSVVLVTTGNRSFWPETSTSLFDLDQVTTLLTTITILALSRRKTLQLYILRLGRLGRF